jgi:hypothetical protein
MLKARLADVLIAFRKQRYTRYPPRYIRPEISTFACPGYRRHGLLKDQVGGYALGTANQSSLS